MAQSNDEVKTVSMLPTSRRKLSKPLRTGRVNIQDGKPVLMAMVHELQSRGYPIELRNIQVDGKWVAHLRLPGQMWTNEGDIQGSEKCEN